MIFLVINMPCYSHTIPTLGFITELVKRGHTVDVISNSLIAPNIKGMIYSTGARYIESLPVENITDSEAEQEQYHISKGKISGRFQTAIILTAYQHAERINYNALIYDFFAFPVYYFSLMLGVPVIRLCSNFAWNGQIVDRLAEDENTYKQNVLARIFGDTIVGQMEWLAMKTLGFDFRMNALGQEVLYNTPLLNIINVLKEMQPQAESFDERFLFAPSVVPSPPGDLKIPYDKMKGKIIYASFGTVFTTLEGDACINAFKEVIRSFKDTDASVIISLGSALPLKDLTDIPENIFVYDFVPQTEVLQHASLFITHGGANSVNESIYYGVPMLVVPGGFDQFIMADQVEIRQIGYKMEQGNFSARRLNELSFSILSDNEIYNNIRQLQSKMTSVDYNKAIADRIEKFMSRLSGRFKL